MQLARTFLVMGPMAVHFCPWFLAITCCAKMRGQLSPHLKKLPALLRKSSSIPLFNSIPFEIKVGITTHRRLMELAKREMRLAFYSCGGYIFTIGWAFGYLFIMDTHAIFHELGGNGNGLVKVFLQDDRQLAAEDLCAWVWKRLSQSGVKSCAQQSVAEMTKSR